MVDLKIGSHIIEGVELAIFDKDGTLIELYHYWSQMVAMRAREISKRYGLGKTHEDNLIFEMGIDVKNLKMRPEGPVGLKKREIVLKAAVDYLSALGCDDAHAACQEVFSHVDEVSALLADELVLPIDGARRLVNELHLGDCKVAIATTDITGRAKLAMSVLGFDKACDLLLGADIVEKPKPDPEAAKTIMEKLAVDRSHTVVIGDALTDVQMGLNAGVRASVGVLTGFATLEQFSAITPYVGNSVADIEVMTPGGKRQ